MGNRIGTSGSYRKKRHENHVLIICYTYDEVHSSEVNNMQQLLLQCVVKFGFESYW